MKDSKTRKNIFRRRRGRRRGRNLHIPYTFALVVAFDSSSLSPSAPITLLINIVPLGGRAQVGGGHRKTITSLNLCIIIKSARWARRMVTSRALVSSRIS